MGLKQYLTGLMFPQKCPFCRGILRDGEKSGGVCAECEAKLPYTASPRSDKLGEFFDFCISPLYYRGVVRSAVLRFKFSGAVSSAAIFARMMADAVSNEPEAQFDIVTWAPISKKRLKRRGYDQSKLLAARLAEKLSAELIEALVKTRHTPPQSGLEGQARRRANVSGAYEAMPGVKVSGKRILLVDDILTTGATLSECSRMLLMAGAESVICVTAARTE